MQLLSVEVNGVQKDATLAQLRFLVRAKYVSESSRLWIDGRECVLGDVMDQVMSAAETLTAPDGATVPDAEPTNETKCAPDAKPKTVAQEPSVPPVAATDASAKNKIVLYIAIGVAALSLMAGGIGIGVGMSHKAPSGSADVQRNVDPSMAPEKDDSKETSDDANVEDLDKADVSKEETSAESDSESWDDSEDAEKTNSQDEDDDPFDFESAADGEEETNDKETSSDKDSSSDKDESDGGYLTHDFDRSMTKIPAGFRGVDIEKLYQTCHNRLSLVKDEYETTDEFEVRKRNFYNNSSSVELYEDLTLGSCFAYVVTPRNMSSHNPNDSIYMETSYDADKKELLVKQNVYFDFSIDYIYRDKFSFSSFSLKNTLVKSGSYTGTNSFGVEKKISEEEEEWYALLFEDTSKEKLREFKLEDVSVDAARSLKNAIGVVCVFNLCFPQEVNKVTFRDMYHHKPTIDYPYDSSSYRYGLVASRNAEFWLFDVNSGEILAKFGYNEVLQGKSKTLGDLAVNSVTKPKSSSEKKTTEPDVWTDDKEDKPIDLDVKKKPKPRKRVEEPKPKTPIDVALEPDGSLDVAFQELSERGGTIVLAASEEPYVVKNVATFNGKNITLKSASGDPSSAVVAFAVQSGGVFGALKGTNCTINFEGVTLKYDKGGSNFKECIMLDFYDKAIVSFKNCVLDGAGLDRSTGVFVKDVGSTLDLSGVTFQGFKVGLQTTRSAKTTADGSCVFGPANGQALVVEDSGEVNVSGANFVQNETACYVGNQGKGSVGSSTFSGNGKSFEFGSFAGRSFKHEGNVGE